MGLSAELTLRTSVTMGGLGTLVAGSRGDLLYLDLNAKAFTSVGEV